MNRTGYFTLILILILCCCPGVLRAQQINFLNPDHYSFEDGGSGVYYQQTAEYWSVSSDRGAGDGSFSLKFTSTEPVPSGQKAKVGQNGTEINLPAGDYTFKVKVWLAADAEINGFMFNLKEPWYPISFGLDTIAREEWVELSVPASLDTDVVNSHCIIRLDDTNVGKGTMYVDDIEFWGEKPEEILDLPFISSIKTTEEALLNLSTGVYDVKMMVWKESGTTISSIYTSISDPWALMPWDIDTVTEGKWLALEQELWITDTVADATFTLQVNNSPEYGGGIGSVYMDDIEFIRIADYIAVDELSLSDSELYLNVSETHMLEHVLLPGDATNRAVTWISANPSIASVDADGLVTAAGKGETSISIFSADGGFVARCGVIVSVAVESVSLSHTEITIDMGEQFQLTDTVLPLDANNREVGWSSDEEALASVGDNGLVSGLTPGTAVITVTTAEGGFIARCEVRVQDTVTAVFGVETGGISLWPNPFTTELFIEPGQDDLLLQVYDLSGVLLLNDKILGSEQILFSPSYEELPTGMYVMKIYNTQGCKIAKIVRK